METSVRLGDLAAMHPRLLCSETAACAAAVLVGPQTARVVRVPMECRNLPAFGSAEIVLNIDCSQTNKGQMDRLHRTYEPSRLVELAAIAISGLALYHGGGHEIMDVALRGSAADYLVDASRNRLEIAGRSRRHDLEGAWQQKLARFSQQEAAGFYISVVEFETPAGRLAFFE